MRKTLLLLLTLFLLSSPAFAKKHPAKTSETPDSTASPWYAGMGTGFNLPLSGWSPDYSLGGGGDLFVGYKLDDTWALQLDVNQWFFTGAGHSTYNPRILPELRWSAPVGELSPYALAGFGYDLQFDNPSGFNTSATAAVLGLGVQYPLKEGEYLFLEIRTDLLFYQGATPQDLPVLLGLSEDL